MITETLKEIEEQLTTAGFKMKNIDFVLFVGQGTSNDHAFKDDKKFMVWLPLEGYETKLQAKVFITHEIIHAFHYARSSNFYFNNVAEKRSIGRQLITEGLATYLSMKVLKVDEGTALWADYLTNYKLKSWFQEYLQKEKMLCGFILKNFSSSDPKIGLFYANDPTDIVNYRAGYYVGLKLIEDSAKKEGLSDQDLLNISRNSFENIAKRWLQERSS